MEIPSNPEAPVLGIYQKDKPTNWKLCAPLGVAARWTTAAPEQQPEGPLIGERAKAAWNLRALDCRPPLGRMRLATCNHVDGPGEYGAE